MSDPGIESSTSEATLAGVFEESILQGEERVGATFQSIRKEAFSKLQTLPFPTERDERWRYTKPKLFSFGRLAKGDLKTLQVSGGEAFAKSLDSVPQELWSFIDWNEDTKSMDAVNILQTAASDSGVFIDIPAKSNLNLPLRIRADEYRSGIPTIVIRIGAASKVTIFDELISNSTESFFGRYEVLIEEGAELNFISPNFASSDTQLMMKHRFHLKRNADLRTHHVLLGAKATRLDLDCILHGEGANADLYSMYLGDGKRHVGVHTEQDHRARNCRSNLLSKGILRDEARTVYCGFIRVRENAQQTDAYQKNKNLLFSNEARADSIPNLEIKANDVKCSHGATLGQVREDELFYLMTRGLTRDQAKLLLVEGFLDEILISIRNEEIREDLRAKTIERVVYEKSPLCPQ